MTDLKSDTEGPDEKGTLAEFAYGRISEALISGRYKPGEKLTLRGLSDTLGISSTPIRDAIRQLSADKAIDFAPNRHIRVPVLTGAELLELRDIRLALEGQVVELAAESIDAESVARLRALDFQIRELRSTGRVQEVVELIQLLHFTIYAASKRENLVQIIKGLWLRTAPYVRFLFPHYSLRERGTMRGLLIDALERRDLRAARVYIGADISGAMDFIIAVVDAGGLEEDRPE